MEGEPFFSRLFLVVRDDPSLLCFAGAYPMSSRNFLQD